MSDLINRYRQQGSQSPKQAQIPVEPAASLKSQDLTDLGSSQDISLTEEQAEVLYAEGTIDAAELDGYFGEFKKLANSPKPGSILHIFRSHKIGGKEMEHFFTDVYLKRLGPIIIDPEVELHTYILYSLVLSHSNAVELAEKVQDHVATGNGLWELLSSMTGHKMKDRGDLTNLVRAILRRYPKILDFLVPKRSVIKTK